ncbi:MAG: tyrosine-type recombinase/integrase [Dehalococcoidia bacterium]|jgi:site-specific recombinase XerD
MTATIIPTGEEAAGWERAMYAFLAEKERRSGSRRTVEGYSRTLQHFFGTMGKPPDKIASQEVFACAYGKGLSGKEPSAITIGARLACLSSFYRFLIRMEIVSANPCDQIERPKPPPSPPRGISAEGIRKLLAVIPETPAGLRDKAIVLTLVLTGQRRAEVFNLKVGDLIRTDGPFYTYRGKGGKRGKRELPPGSRGVLFVMNGTVDSSAKITHIYDRRRRQMDANARRDRLTQLPVRSWRRQLAERTAEHDASRLDPQGE